MQKVPSTFPEGRLRIGIDIGGTFTDFVVFDPSSGHIHTFKLPSTPHDPAEAVLLGLSRISERSTGRDSQAIDLWNITHGSTVATNALLERKGARTALITTRGFKDVLQIRRQNRPELYDFASSPAPPLIPAEMRLEVDERVDHRGKVTTALEEEQIDQAISKLQSPTASQQSPVDSVAVVLLFSFANPEHEQRITEKLRAAGFFASASHEILPEYREYERTSTTAVNAYVSPVLDRYLSQLENALTLEKEGDLRTSNPEHPASGPSTSLTGVRASMQIMQSNGGSISVGEARRNAVRCILSGPAGGVVGSQYVGELVMSPSPSTPAELRASPEEERRLSGQGTGLRMLTFDMGGTSTDVSLIDSQPQITTEAEVGGHPIAIPLLDIHAIGAGGGSIAYIDAGGALRVGPESAGADPGPACYGKTMKELSSGMPRDGEGRNSHPSLHVHNYPQATVTDANVLLGRIPPDDFLGGAMPLYSELAEKALKRIGEELGLSATETALGVIEIANAHMERALRVTSVERGYDPRDFTLLSFGGAGGLHAADLARKLRIPEVLISPYASTFSAFGMLAADVIKDYTQTVMLPGRSSSEEISDRLAPLAQKGRDDLHKEGILEENIILQRSLDMRYRGQSYELNLPFAEDFINDFHQAHRQTYGYDRPGGEIEIVNLRVRAVGQVPSPQIAPQAIQSADASAAQIDYRPVVFTDGTREIPFYRGEMLQPGNQITGPAIVVRDDTTILINQSDRASVDAYLNLRIKIGNQK